MMTKFGFVCAHIYCNYLMTYLYLGVLNSMRMVRFVSSAESLRILTILVLVCNVTGMCLMMKRHRTWFVVILHTLMPYGISTVLSYVGERKGAIIGGLAAAIAATGVYAFLIFRQKIKNRAKRRTIMLKRVGKVFAGLHCCVGTVLAVFAILCFVRVFNTRLEVTADVPATMKISYTDEELRKVEADFMKLAESRWETLTLREKLDVLQVVANLEQSYLGISQTLTVVAEDMKERTCGYYDDYEWTIHLNRAHLEEKSAKFVLDTVCHEAYHAYQKRLVEVYCRVDEKTRNLMMFRQMETYLWETILYVDTGADYMGYYNQDTEAHARAYAEERVKAYYDILETMQSADRE